jgi:putative ABC transport system substrate-binding protein
VRIAAADGRRDLLRTVERVGFLALAIIILLITARTGETQPSPKVSRIGYLSPLSADADAPNLTAFREGLRALGYVEGQSVLIDARHADGEFERLRELAAEIVGLKVDVIVAGPTPAVRAVQRATQTIPIVMALSGDPVGEGFAAGLARPGGNITGHSAAVTEMIAKRVEFLKALVPRLSHVSYLANAESTRRSVIEVETAGRILGVQVATTLVRDSREVDRAFSDMRQARVGGLIVALALQHHWKQIVDLAARNRLPTVSGPREFVEAGGLLAYGPDIPDLFRRAATYVDKILKGTRPGDLPIEEPTKFELVISRRTAKVLGLTIPPPLLARADHVLD